MWVGKNSSRVGLPSTDRKGMWGNGNKLRKEKISYPPKWLCTSDVLVVCLALGPAHGVPAIGDLGGGTASFSTPTASVISLCTGFKIGIGLTDSRGA